MKIVYANTVDYNMELQQRPHHIMNTLARRGHEVHWVNHTQIKGRSNNTYGNLTLWHDWDLFLSKHPTCDVYFSSWASRHVDLEQIKAKIVVYDSLDNFAINEHNEPRMINKADVVLTTSKPLYDLRSTQHSNVHMCRNGCWPNLANEIKDDITIKDVNGDFILFSGAVAEWVDVELINELAEQFQVVIAGVVFPHLLELLPSKKCKVVGAKTYIELQKYYKKAKVNLIPFKRCQTSDYSNPIKMYESAVFGTPTVSIDIPEAVIHNDAICVESNHVDFINTVKTIIENPPTQDYKNMLMNFAQENSWEDRVDLIEREIETAFRNKKTVIYCLCEVAYQYDGVSDYLGGGEKWFDDFLTILETMKYPTKVYQFSNERWEKQWRGHTLVGLGNMDGSPLSRLNGLDEFNRLAKENKASGIFYLTFNLCYEKMDINSIVVSHGIFFDRADNSWNLNPIEELNNFAVSCSNANHIISVDTNTVHQMAVYAPENLWKMSYIPNYVDTLKFTPYKKKDNGKFTVLYPRRLDNCRGYLTVMEAADYLLKKYKNIEFIFCGKGASHDEEVFSKWYETKKDRVKWFSLQPEKMNEVYRMADVSLICSWFAEGTSLSCLESLATGVPCIVTTVGGLSDLIQPNVNGIVIPPKNTESLISAIEHCMHNPDHMKEMRENGLRMVKHFDKVRWTNQIKKVVKGVYGEPFGGSICKK